MSLSDLVKILWLATVLTKVSETETRSSLVALAWALRNREKIRRGTSKPLGKSNISLLTYEAISCQGRSMTVRSWRILGIFRLGLDEEFCRSLAIAALVWSGEEVDPTAGSTHFHRHDDWPEWAKNSQPVALIGSWFFYNEIDTYA